MTTLELVKEVVTLIEKYGKEQQAFSAIGYKEIINNLEMHPDDDQFIRIEDGRGFVQMGDIENMLDFEEMVYDDYIFIIPAGKWHNIINIGDKPVKLYAIYAPPEHPFGTVHDTKQDAENEELVDIEEDSYDEEDEYYDDFDDSFDEE